MTAPDSFDAMKFPMLKNGMDFLLSAVEHLQGDPDSASRSRLESGDFISVEFPSLVKRLASVCGVLIEESDRRIIESVRKKRNSLEIYVDFVPECFKCGSRLVLGDGDPRCEECGWSATASDAAPRHITEVLGRHPYDIAKRREPESQWECPRCDEYALVETGLAGGYQAASVDYTCYSCGNWWVSGMMLNAATVELRRQEDSAEFHVAGSAVSSALAAGS